MRSRPASFNKRACFSVKNPIEQHECVPVFFISRIYPASSSISSSVAKLDPFLPIHDSLRVFHCLFPPCLSVLFPHICFHRSGRDASELYRASLRSGWGIFRLPRFLKIPSADTPCTVRWIPRTGDHLFLIPDFLIDHLSCFPDLYFRFSPVFQIPFGFFLCHRHLPSGTASRIQNPAVDEPFQIPLPDPESFLRHESADFFPFNSFVLFLTCVNPDVEKSSSLRYKIS